MKLILLSGGSGKRLWPLSNDSRSKQFLKVLRNQDGEFESMVQRVWRQLGKANLQQDTYIATSMNQTEVLRNQLGEQVPIITEPERRDTFPAIVLAASYLASEVNVDPDETVVVLPVDPYVEYDFYERVEELCRVVDRFEANIALMGVRPTYPSEKYGYIVPDQQLNRIDRESVLRVSHFREKPRQDQASELIEQSALWNCGVFAFKLQFAIRLLEQRNLPVSFPELVKEYGRLTKKSFDHEVVEKTNNIVALPYEGTWKDLGTWNTLTEEMNTSQIGIGIVSEDSHNTHLINELNIPVTITGLSGIVVATSPDGILVADKASTPRLKELVHGLNQRPMHEERRWGEYSVVDYTEFPDGRKSLTKKIRIFAGKNLSYHFHFKRSEVWTIIAGSGELVLEEEHRLVREGDVIHIPPNCKHSILASETMDIIEVQLGTSLIEEDIYRLTMDWTEILGFWIASQRNEVEA
ncbi:sugar phosphate nucleotidyltransferase [Cohnella sp. AR92]|uniref:sugar phosphate nucleotidyltransferase n=1 Tax=Cohnella sp. AR92 TaxID=648716 RepID=UPI000F8CB280|nr:sugar phosphate nucleotidyltransferase [Cohnella sp. AR92]RUS45290.1 cupin domain-containing protein [Cohnella sp. AR92]